MKPLLRIRGKHIKNGRVGIMEYYSVRQAKYHNPDFCDWEILGMVKK